MPTRPVVLDSGPLGKLAHPLRNREMAEWFEYHMSVGTRLIIPEIADYEVRRSFLLEGLTGSILRLNALQKVIAYQPLTTAAMLRAAELWAQMRRQGKPLADRHALDGDVILAAQAEELKAIVATDNVGHLDRIVEAKDWRVIR